MVGSGGGDGRESIGLAFLQKGCFLVKFFESKDVFSVDKMVMVEITLIAVNFDADLRYFFGLEGGEVDDKVLGFKFLVF